MQQLLIIRIDPREKKTVGDLAWAVSSLVNYVAYGAYGHMRRGALGLEKSLLSNGGRHTVGKYLLDFIF